MKTKLSTFYLVIFLLIFTSCKKEIAKLEGKTCWKCQVKGYPDAPNPNDKDYTTTKCWDKDYPPQFKDDYGNFVNADCTKQ